MDRSQLMAQIEKNSVHRRRRTDYVNSLMEDFYFSDFALRKLDNLIAPMQAGITHPDPEYYCYPASDDKAASRLLVLEYVVKGKGYIEYKGKVYPVQAGDSYIINRICGHRWYADPNDPYEKKWVNIGGRFLESLTYAYQMTGGVYVEPVSIEAQLDEIHRILLDYNFQDPRQDNLRLMHQLVDIFDKINYTRNAEREKPDRVMFEQIRDYVTANLLYEQLTPTAICNSFFISRSTLLRMFEKNVGVPPAKYIVLQRIEYAKQLLLSTDYTVDRISAVLFFSSSRHFYKVFRETVGMAPTAWRKENLKNAKE